ncbi:hypothetical protein EON66_08570 [archaeon]|nr:MAG: hypothetical protein EON66_08570 [archaeon]
MFEYAECDLKRFVDECFLEAARKSAAADPRRTGARSVPTSTTTESAGSEQEAGTAAGSGAPGSLTASSGGGNSKTRGIDIRYVKAFMYQLLRGTAYFHSRRVLHRYVPKLCWVLRGHPVCEGLLGDCFRVPCRACMHAVT